MTGRIRPSGITSQTVLILLAGALLGLVARAAGPSDFEGALAPPPQADSDEIARLREQPTAPETGTAQQPAPERPKVVIPKKVSFIDFRAQLYGQPGVHVIDARDAGSYEGGHIPGALHLDGEAIERDANAGGDVLAGIPQTDVVVVYCSGGSCDLSMRVARNLVAKGYQKILVYEGGWTEWIQEDGSRATGLEPGTPDGG